MAVQDLWIKADGSHSARYGRGRRYRVSVPGHPSESYRTKDAARRREAQMLSEGPIRESSTVTVGDLVDRWLAGKASLSRGGRDAAKAAAAQVRTRWGSVPAVEVRAHEVQEWLASLQVRRGRRAALTPASVATKVKALSALRGALAIAVECGDLAANPADKARAGRQVRHDTRYLDVGELRDLAEAMGPHWSPMVWLMGTTGIRIGEAVALRVRDVDARRRRLRVRLAKSGRARDVPIPDSVLGMLSLDRPPGDRLLVGREGGPVDPDHWRRRQFARAVKAAGLEGLRPHDLRHTAASLMIASGATIKDVQAALGHASATMTLDLYGHRFDGHLDDVGTRMDRLVTGFVPTMP